MARRRRGNNEGCIYHRKDGSWCAQISLQGKRITKYARTQHECRQWVKDTLNKIEHGLTFEGSQLSVEAYMKSWLSGKALARRPATVHNYKRYTEQYILPMIGKLRLQAVVPGHIRQLYLRMQLEGKGARTIQLVHVTLNCAFGQAVKEGLIGHNPLDGVERPKVETKHFEIFTEEQARDFLTAAQGHKYEALYYLALTTSLRKGEILGLRWTDVDWTKGTLKVERQLQQANWRAATLVPTKTKSSRRMIKLGHRALAMLEDHRQKQEQEKLLAGDRWQEHGMIFTTSIGTYIDQTKVSREFKALLRKANLPEIRFHDLRHTSLSFLLDRGTPVNTVQKRAGHSKASVTTDIYGHALDRSDEIAAEEIEDIVTPLTNDLQ